MTGYKKTLILLFSLIHLPWSVGIAEGQPPPKVPAKDLDQQHSKGPQVVYPHTKEVVEDTISDIEDLQLTPGQFDRLKRIYLERERQKSTPYTSPAKPMTRTMFVNLDPGISPPVLRLSRGQQSSVIFSDLSGQPWFIEHISMNRQLFSDGRQIQ